MLNKPPIMGKSERIAELEEEICNLKRANVNERDPELSGLQLGLIATIEARIRTLQ